MEYMTRKKKPHVAVMGVIVEWDKEWMDRWVNSKDVGVIEERKKMKLEWKEWMQDER